MITKTPEELNSSTRLVNKGNEGNKIPDFAIEPQSKKTSFEEYLDLLTSDIQTEETTAAAQKTDIPGPKTDSEGNLDVEADTIEEKVPEKIEEETKTTEKELDKEIIEKKLEIPQVGIGKSEPIVSSLGNNELNKQDSSVKIGDINLVGESMKVTEKKAESKEILSIDEVVSAKKMMQRGISFLNELLITDTKKSELEEIKLPNIEKTTDEKTESNETLELTNPEPIELAAPKEILPAVIEEPTVPVKETIETNVVVSDTDKDKTDKLPSELELSVKNEDEEKKVVTFIPESKASEENEDIEVKEMPSKELTSQSEDKAAESVKIGLTEEDAAKKEIEEFKFKPNEVVDKPDTQPAVDKKTVNPEVVKSTSNSSATIDGLLVKNEKKNKAEAGNQDLNLELPKNFTIVDVKTQETKKKGNSFFIVLLLLLVMLAGVALVVLLFKDDPIVQQGINFFKTIFNF